jgi:hypothetical protein
MAGGDARLLSPFTLLNLTAVKSRSADSSASAFKLAKQLSRLTQRLQRFPSLKLDAHGLYGLAQLMRIGSVQIQQGATACKFSGSVFDLQCIIA